MLRYVLVCLVLQVATKYHRAFGDDFDRRPFFATSVVSENSQDVAVKLKYEMAAELLAMALGKHVFFFTSLLRPETYDNVEVDANVDKEQHLIAMTIVQLLQQLGTMESIDNFVSDTVEEIIATEQDRVNYTNIFYAKCERLKNDAIYEEFARTKERMVKKYDSLPGTRRRLNDILAPDSIEAYARFVSKIYDHVDVRRVMLSTDFLEARTSAHPHERITVTALLKWSRNPHLRDEVERIYKNVLYEMTERDSGNDNANLSSFLDGLNARLKGSTILNSDPMKARLR